ncbi:response regulator [Thauera sp. 2A1]|uniref:response regulator n=1 Tax=Thauera sp. 2A1 TaxID=2570191 RepID=UPI001291EFA5|nr:response regulator [Thauera sp. 2A1]KAI5914234.1 response regulator [Thauera sp. 2A1]
MRILLVEDDEALRSGLCEALEKGHFAVDALPAAEPAEHALQHVTYDLAIVDIGLPGIDGFELIRRVRRRGIEVPVLVLTARDSLEDRVVGLDQGADDYLVKPFEMPELLARMRALIRRSRASAGAHLSLGPLALDLGNRSATLDGAPLELTGREWGVLEQLMLAAPKLVTKKKLADSLSQWDKEITSNAIEIYVSRLRVKLAESRIAVRTLRGIGYRIEEEDAAPD